MLAFARTPIVICRAKSMTGATRPWIRKQIEKDDELSAAKVLSMKRVHEEVMSWRIWCSDAPVERERT